MTDLIEQVGPLLGVVAFVGLAVLAFLIFQQAREVRRLREWAGRAPERAAEAAEASLAAAEARGETIAAEEKEAEPTRGRLAQTWDSFREWAAPRYAALDRRMPVDPRYLLVVVAAAIIAAAAVTSGFGILDEEAGGGGGGGSRAGGGGGAGKPEVAVLNATQVETGGTVIEGVEGLAAKVAAEVVRPAGYDVARTDNAASGVEQTVVMYEPGGEGDAERLAERVSDQLGQTGTQPMVAEVADLAGDAPLVLVVGQDDEGF